MYIQIHNNVSLNECPNSFLYFIHIRGKFNALDSRLKYSSMNNDNEY